MVGGGFGDGHLRGGHVHRERGVPEGEGRQHDVWSGIWDIDGRGIDRTDGVGGFDLDALPFDCAGAARSLGGAYHDKDPRNDGRIWVPKNIEDAKSIREGKLNPTEIKEENRDYYLERRYPAFGNLVPRDVASRAAKERCDEGYGVNKTGEAVYLDFSTAIQRYGKEEAHVKGLNEEDGSLVKKLGQKIVKSKYGNLFQMYEKIVDQDPYEVPMMIYPAVHYTMGGVWVDYNLMTSIPGCYAIGEANFSDHGANRLGASALMQGLADGYFVLPYTIGDYLSDDIRTGKISTDTPEFIKAEEEVRVRLAKFIYNQGKHPVDYYHRKLGKIMWNKCGMSRNEKDLKEAIIEIKALREDFYENVRVPGGLEEFNEELAKAGRVADFLELGELFAKDALERTESCGGHFREESQTPEGEALRDPARAARRLGLALRARREQRRLPRRRGRPGAVGRGHGDGLLPRQGRGLRRGQSEGPGRLSSFSHGKWQCS